MASCSLRPGYCGWDGGVFLGLGVPCRIFRLGAKRDRRNTTESTPVLLHPVTRQHSLACQESRPKLGTYGKLR